MAPGDVSMPTKTSLKLLFHTRSDTMNSLPESGVGKPVLMRITLGKTPIRQIGSNVEGNDVLQSAVALSLLHFTSGLPSRCRCF
jgi:hypothetical protein